MRTDLRQSVCLHHTISNKTVQQPRILTLKSLRPPPGAAGRNMDDINDFFNFSKPFKRETISGGYVNGRTVPSTVAAPAKREHAGTEYVHEFRAREHANLTKV